MRHSPYAGMTRTGSGGRRRVPPSQPLGAPAVLSPHRTPTHVPAPDPLQTRSRPAPDPLQTLGGEADKQRVKPPISPTAVLQAPTSKHERTMRRRLGEVLVAHAVIDEE